MMTEKGYAKASASNLPKVDMLMVAQFMKNNANFVSAEVRSRKLWGFESYIQLSRDGSICSVKAKISPEHRMNSKAYNVEAVIDEDDDIVQGVACHDCAASLGGCKHAIALLMWLHRRAEDPAPTSTECYWKKSKFSDVGRVKKFIPATEMGRPLEPLADTLPSFLSDLTNKLKSANVSCQLLKHLTPDDKYHSISLHSLSLKFLEESRGNTVNDFFLFCSKSMTEKLCCEAYNNTIEQSNSAIWHELRYGRMTASKLHEAAHCKTVQGTLVETLLGASRIKESQQMRRGRELEKEVLNVVQQKEKLQIKQAGLLLNPSYPIFGASPDGTTTNGVIEIKCPSSAKAKQAYLSADGTTKEKYLAQIQMQMFFSNKKMGKTCVASPSFEKDKEVTIVDVTYDKEMCDSLIEKALSFWKEAVSPILLKKM